MSTNKLGRLRFKIMTLLIITAFAAVLTRFAANYGPVEISFRDLELTPTTPQTVTRSIQNLHQKKVLLRGFIYPTSVFRAKGIREFVLCCDNQEPRQSMEDWDFVVIRMGKETPLDFTTRPIAIEGKFSVLTPPLTAPGWKLYYQIENAKRIMQ